LDEKIMTMTLQHQDLKVAEAVVTAGTTAPAATRGLYARFGKRLLDVTIVLLSAPIVLPVLLLAAIANLLSGNPIFYSQLRLGRDSHVFRIWKLSTMRPDADKMLEELLENDVSRRREWATTQKLKDDPRVTRVGTLLRRTSIDEIPQLFNVLKGDMSLLGPRPMMLDQIDLYGPTLPAYLSLRPGISGKWQVSERNDANFRRRAQIDAEYASSVSLKADVVLIWKTLRTLVRSTGY
jgi:lipopolysaccharide/colanic/teichoic acid biosynthesis glycosyltransferase